MDSKTGPGHFLKHTLRIIYIFFRDKKSMFHQLLKAPLRVYMISILHQAYMDFTMLEYIAYNLPVLFH